VLRGVDLRLVPGTITEVVGANGSGKSTLVRVVAGLTPPTQGSVRSRPRSVAYAPERLPARLRMTARDYVGHMARLRGADPAPYEALLDRLALSPGVGAPIRALSKGNSQKVALAQALAPRADLVLLDEPASGLDGSARTALCEVVAERRAAGAAILLTTHLPLDGLKVDEVFELHAGGLVSPGPTPAPATVRIELLSRGDGRRRALEVTADRSDAVLAAALAEGWSVVSVAPVTGG
jgi:ABC-2 type transport system ATP-binding protein